MPNEDFYESKEQFCELMGYLTLSSLDAANFSGMGLALYNPETFDHRWHKSLRPSYNVPCANISDIEEAVSRLLEIARKNDPQHDGFHFIDGATGQLEYAAQIFFIPIIEGAEVNENYGTRYHTAMYGSNLKGIILTGVIGAEKNDRKCHIFGGGRLIETERERKSR